MVYTSIELGIFSIWRKIRFYRRLILFTCLISAVSILSGIVTAGLLYQGAFDLSTTMLQQPQFESLTADQWQTLQTMAQRESSLTQGLIAISILSFLFGFVIPVFVLGKLIGALRHLEANLRETLKELVKDMTETLEKYGDEPFANARYWTEVSMILLQFMARESRHPSLILASDLVQLTREEMKLVKK